MLAELSDRSWFWTAAWFYLAGFVLGTLSLLRGGRPSSALTYICIVAGYAVQLFALGIRGRVVAGCPLGNQFEIYQFVAWSAITLYLVVGVTFRNSLLGFFTSSLAATLTLASLLMPGWDATQRSHIFGSNPWIELHAAMAVFSYGVFALLALTSVLFLLRNHSLKSKQLGGWFSFLPSIMDLDQIGRRLLAAGVTILTAALAIISIFWLRNPGSAAPVKILFTVAVWAVAVVTLVLRLRGTLIAKRFAWSCLILFFAALISLGVVDRTRKPAPASREVHAS
jgi:HemX protein